MSLAKSTILGISWSSISQFGRQGIQDVTTLILAALLLPSDFGLMAIALIFVGFLNLFRDVGMSAAVIHKEELSESLLSSIFWMNLLFGLILALVIFLSAPYVAVFYNERRIDPILKVLSSTFLIMAFSLLQKALLEKNLKFKQLARIELIAVIFGSSSGIVLAIMGYGVWSLVFQSILNTLITTILLWKESDFRPKLNYSYVELKSLLGYSLNLAGYNLFNYFVRNSDYLLIGKFLGNDALGHYYLAYKIMLYPVQNISGVISRVLFPIYSSIKTDLEKFRLIYVKISRTIALITFPLMVGIFIISRPFVITFFSSHWDHNLLITLIMILSPIGMIQALASTTGSIYMSIGKTNIMFLWGVVTGIVYVSGFLIGIQFGVLGVAISYLITTIIFLIPVFHIPFRFISLDSGLFFKSLKSIFLSSLIMLTIDYSLLLIIASIGVNPIFQLIIVIPGGILIFLLTLWILDKNIMLELVSRLKQLKMEKFA